MNNCKTKKSVRRRNIKHSRVSPDVPFKESSLTKQKTKPRTNYEWMGNTIKKKNPIQKIEKTVKIKVKLPRVNKKTTSEKSNFCSNTVFSLDFKFRAKKIHAANNSFFRSTSCFGLTKNYYSNLKKKTDLKKKTNYLNC